MAKYRITHIRKPNVNSTHEHITHVKLEGHGIYTVEQIIGYIEVDKHTFYVKVGSSESSVSVVHPKDGRNDFIRTSPDKTEKDNLLSLDQC